MNKIIPILAALALSLPHAAFADDANPADALKGELTYRVNLGRADDVKMLLDKGASVETADENGLPLILLAANRSDPEAVNVVKVLVAGGANINTKDKDGETALFYAAKQGNGPTVDWLLRNGANYYAANNKGDIARTLAFRAGHTEIVTQMDNYIKEQQENVRKQYEESNKLMEQRYKEQQEALMKAQAELQKQADEAAQKTADEQKKLGDEKNKFAKDKADQEEKDKAKADAEAKAKAEQESQPPQPSAEETAKATRPILRELAYHSCAFQYWAYCKSSGQPTELTRDELKLAIDSHRERALNLSQNLISDYKLQAPYLSGIQDAAKSRIFSQIDAMPSKIERHEQGVGKMDDLQTRCDDIADSWDEEAAPGTTTKPGRTANPAGPAKQLSPHGGRKGASPMSRKPKAEKPQSSAPAGTAAAPAAKDAPAASNTMTVNKSRRHGNWNTAPKFDYGTTPQQTTPQ